MVGSWLKTRQIEASDTMIALSICGGNADANVSPRIVTELVSVERTGAGGVGIAGESGDVVERVADTLLMIPGVHPADSVPQGEAI